MRDMKTLCLGLVLFFLSVAAHANVFEDRAKEFCDKGEADICTDLGKYYREGNAQYQIQKDLTKALELLTKGCDLGGSEGCNELGLMHDNGQGTKKDAAKALSLYQKSCEGGVGAGCLNAAMMYDAGQGVKKDLSKAFGLYQKACEGSVGAGCYKLGFKYYKGEGIAKSESNALKYLTQSCTLKFKDGCDASAQLKSGKLK
jgi:hypothetical protein